MNLVSGMTSSTMSHAFMPAVNCPHPRNLCNYLMSKPCTLKACSPGPLSEWPTIKESGPAVTHRSCEKITLIWAEALPHVFPLLLSKEIHNWNSWYWGPLIWPMLESYSGAECVDDIWVHEDNIWQWHHATHLHSRLPLMSKSWPGKMPEQICRGCWYSPAVLPVIGAYVC